MENQKVLNVNMFGEVMQGISMFSDNLVEIIGEQTVELEDGRVIEQWLYNIVGYTPENGKPFASLKANIIITGGN